VDNNVLIKVKATLRLGDTLVPLIVMSDGTHLPNFAGNTKEWPAYMTIGNLSTKIHQMPSAHTIVIVAVLPIPKKNRNIPQMRLNEQRQTHREVLNEVVGYSSLSLSNSIPAPRAGITMFSVQIATSGFANRF
jgi:hypothetical protein